MVQKYIPDDDDGVDLNILLKSTKAIITTNQEILERCEEYEDKSSTSKSAEGMKLTRFGFIKVNVTTVLAGNSSSLEFASTPELSVRDFGLPVPVPEELREIIAFEMNGIFPDYESLLGRAVLLHDDLLIPFLLNLKEHLENIQVYLGTIEAWLMGNTRLPSVPQRSLQAKTCHPIDPGRLHVSM
jgi:hypothetical protein